MFYTTVMVFLEIDDEPTDLMRYSWDLAERYDADLIAFAAVEPRLFGIDGSVLPSDVMSRQVEEIEIRLKVFEEAFQAMTGHSNRASWRCLLGNPTSFLALHSRAADLVIVGGASNVRKSRRLIDVGSLVLRAARPAHILQAGPGQGRSHPGRLERYARGPPRGRGRHAVFDPGS